MHFFSVATRGGSSADPILAGIGVAIVQAMSKAPLRNDFVVSRTEEPREEASASPRTMDEARSIEDPSSRFEHCREEFPRFPLG